MSKLQHLRPVFGGKEGNSMKSTRTAEIMERELLEVNIAPVIYDELKVAWKNEAELLQESMKTWKRPEGGLLYAVTEEAAELVKSMPVQSSLKEIRYGDTTSTVASSGGFIVVTKFLERYFDSEKRVSIEKLAKLSVELGYNKQEDGTCIWFDKFLPRYFRLKSRRIANIKEVLEAIKTRKVPVLLLRDAIYKQDQENTDSHFAIILGVDKYGYHIYDPESPKLIRCEFERIHSAVRVGWIISN